MVDTYYRQIHMPTKYFDKLTGIIAVPDYTCNQIKSLSYNEALHPGEYLCFCQGNNYNGLPDFTFTYYEQKLEYTMTP
jgi:hypothetical protein